MLPAHRLADRDVGVRVPAPVEDPLNHDSFRVMGLGVGVLQLADPHRVPGVAVGEEDLLAAVVGLPLPPVPREVYPVPRGVPAHALPVGDSVLDQDVAEDELPGGDEGIVDEGVVPGVDVLDDPEDAGLDVHGPGVPLLVDPDVGDVVPDDGLPGDHRGARLPAGAGVGPGEVCDPVLAVGVNPHHEHVLRKPVLVVGLVDGEAEGELLEAQAVPSVLVIHRVDLAVEEVDVDAPLLDVEAAVPLVEGPGAVDESEELPAPPEALELLVSAPIKEVLAMGHVGGVGELEGAEAEPGACGPQAEETYQHLLVLHGPVEEPPHLPEPPLPLHGDDAPAQALARWEENRGVGLVPGLVVVPVEVDGVAVHLKRMLLTQIDGPLPHVCNLLGVVGDHGDLGGLAQVDELPHLLEDVRVPEIDEFLKALAPEKDVG